MDLYEFPQLVNPGATRSMADLLVRGLSPRTFSIFRRNLFETAWFQVCGSFAEM